ncbi:hypothetical protein K4L44_08400 [Halosquirtibacter laminarini]|uniref:Uncharacterized protein n=1 Tax=Halosquirtibacter laminarini TaxID=3374600 RepID=A0AC61NQE3_9BACT|nr:hypothetical protein K4L44_08400 [Prolixibacteraceae bacterium]
MEKIYHLEQKVHSFQVDFRKQMRPSSMARIFQEAATIHAEKLGVGYSELNREGVFWVLSKVEMHFIEPLLWDDIYKLETWPVESNGLLFRRDFRFKKEGRIVCEGSSGWLVIDQKRKRPMRASSLSIEFPTLPIEDASTYFKEKVSLKEECKMAPLTVGYSDIDMNQHANNTKYIDWMLQYIPKDTLQQKEIKEILIEYTNEAGWNDILDISMDHQDKNGEDHISFQAVHQKNEKVCFKGRCILG